MLTVFFDPKYIFLIFPENPYVNKLQILIDIKPWAQYRDNQKIKK